MILSIETGGEICSVALSKDGELISLRESDEGRNHARDLALFISEIFKENSIEESDLDAIAISKGPGSYTGLRIGVSVAKGICYAAKKPLISIGSLESLAASAIDDIEAGIVGIDSIEDAILCPMIDARRMEVYEQLFDENGVAITEAKAHIITYDSFKDCKLKSKFIIFGSGAEKCLSTLLVDGLQYINTVQSARGMVKLAHKLFDEGKFEDVAYFEPLYLKEFTAAAPKKLL
ncbi:MAG: tRNA (adenosine(37)-N6)-threonylcarbamoyltransferase complex dimerization subunit type 1 TsaB [Rikenellaceae bacterium]